MAHGRNVGTSDYGTLPVQQADTTICSNDSTYAISNNSMSSSDMRTDGKMKAYVDFTEFNKNYDQYLREQAAQKSNDSSSNKNSSDSSDMEQDRTSQNDVVILDRQSPRSSNQSSQSSEWEVLCPDTT